MGNIVPSLSTGQSIYEAGCSGFSGFRAKDDAADNRDVNGNYSHRAVDMSATEATEWICLWEWMIQQGLSGGGSLKVINSTGTALPAGPISITGYDAVNTAFQAGPSNCYSGTLAQWILLSSLANGGIGAAYSGGQFQSSIDTSSATLGDPVYAAASGISLTQQSGASGYSGYSSACFDQKVGYVLTTEASGYVAGWVQPPSRINGLQIQDGSIGNRHYHPGESCNTKMSSGIPSGGRNGDIVIDSTLHRLYVKYGGGWHYAALT